MDDVREALALLKEAAVSTRQFRDYVNGRHRLAFATDKFQTAFSWMFRAFADNLCAVVVDAVVDRLQVTGFSVDEGPPEAAQEAWRIWKRNRMDARASQAHREALTSGSAYVLVWPDEEGLPEIFLNRSDEVILLKPSGSSDGGSWAAKWWREQDGAFRLNLYYPDRIEKWEAASTAGTVPSAEAFKPYDDGGGWPVPNPYGRVPIFRLVNSGGRSELADVLPLQDALNKALADMLVAMEFVALPQRWATGLEVEIDEETGQPKPPFTPGAERVWAVASEGVRFGQFEPARLDQFLAVQDAFRREIAAVSRTPLHQIIPPNGQWPSGEALRSAESAFLAKVADRQAAFGNAWEDVLAFALEVAGTKGAVLSCLWKDPTPRSTLEQANVSVLKQQLGVPSRQLFRELGYSEQEIENMLAEDEVSGAAAAERIVAAFERGA